MRGIGIRVAVLMSGSILIVCGAGFSAPAGAQRAAPGSVPNPGVSATVMGVSAVSPNGVWAVGTYNDGTSDRTMILHWRGVSWKLVPSPSPGGTSGSSLRTVSADASTDAWAVGSYKDGTRSNTLALRWNGSKWKQITTPSPGPTDAELLGVKALSPTDAWAVGSFFDGTATQPLILHWNGSKWSQVSSPNPPGSGFLFSVDADSSTDIWAVGVEEKDGDALSLTLRSQGSTWTRVPSPSPGAVNAELTDVSVVSPTEAWAVGLYDDVGAEFTLTLHWNGTKWIQVKSPNPGGNSVNALIGVQEISKSDIWAVGIYFNATGRAYSLILHGDGKHWTHVPSPNFGTFNRLWSVSLDSAGDGWVGGGYGDTNDDHNVLAHWDGSSWTAA